MPLSTEQAYMDERIDADICMRYALYAHIAGIGVGLLLILSMTALACVMLRNW
jgi:hypothetical protein